jgi:hypothetical protein
LCGAFGSLQFGQKEAAGRVMASLALRLSLLVLECLLFGNGIADSYLLEFILKL